MTVEAIPLTREQELCGLRGEERTRRQAAYLIQDAKSGTLLLTQKLRNAAEFINAHLAQRPHEKVTVSGLFEAVDTTGNNVDGWHKMRFRIIRVDLTNAHEAFEKARRDQEIRLAMILTATPECYTVR